MWMAATRSGNTQHADDPTEHEKSLPELCRLACQRSLRAYSVPNSYAQRLIVSVRDIDAALREQILDIPSGQRKPEIQPDSMLMIAGECGSGGGDS
jgi:hypothetical protein